MQDIINPSIKDPNNTDEGESRSDTRRLNTDSPTIEHKDHKVTLATRRFTERSLHFQEYAATE